MDLSVLIEPKLDLERLTKILNEMGHVGRTHTIRTWGRRAMKKLWDGVAGYRPITLDHFVPPGVPPKVEVIHELKNSLPLFTISQKRFCRPDDPEAQELWGYNHASSDVFVGPGYFVARPGTVEGEVDIDYRVSPKGRVETWPAIQPAETRLGRFVFGGMVDRMRGISEHVSIGRAHRGDRPMNAWFVLCRKDTPPA